ncbi:MAG: hypothetical protein PHU34_09510 [Candidatus Methanoperedens sp.]|nr:hypothetical protein [Candidatus Methanoperedens sp.]
MSTSEDFESANCPGCGAVLGYQGYSIKGSHTVRKYKCMACGKEITKETDM